MGKHPMAAVPDNIEPVHEDARATRDDQDRPGDVERPLRILIAEDDDTCAYALRRGLRRAGFRVLIAGSSMEAIQLLEHCKIDVLLTDHEMPLVTGGQLCGVLRENPRFQDLPVIMITGKGSELDLRALAKAYRLAAVFSKPFDIMELVQTIRACSAPRCP